RFGRLSGRSPPARIRFQDAAANTQGGSLTELGLFAARSSQFMDCRARGGGDCVTLAPSALTYRSTVSLRVRPYRSKWWIASRRLPPAAPQQGRPSSSRVRRFVRLLLAEIGRAH